MKGNWLKRMLAGVITLMLCCGMFVGCGKQGGESGDIQSSAKESSQTAEGKTLSMTVSNLYAQTFEHAKTLFKAKYPDVTLEIEYYDYQMDVEDVQLICEKVARDAMVGKGADIVVTDYDFGLFSDVFKICKAGAFEDLNTYFDADESWSWDDYNTDVIDGLELAGKQYLMPLYYAIPLLVSDKTALETAGFDLTGCDTGIGLMEQLTDYLNRARQDATLPKMTYNKFHMYNSLNLEPYSFAAPDSIVWAEDFASCIQSYKAYYDAAGLPGEYVSVDQNKSGEDICNGTILFHSDMNANSNTYAFKTAAGIMKAGGEPVLIPGYTADGAGLCATVPLAVAISSTSDCKQEAYAFIKCLLSEQAQCARQANNGTSLAAGTPVYEPALLTVYPDALAKDEVQNADGNWEQRTTEATCQQYKELCHNIAAVKVHSLSDESYDYIRKYLKGETSYENAFAEADSKLKRYISE